MHRDVIDIGNAGEKLTLSRLSARRQSRRGRISGDGSHVALARALTEPSTMAGLREFLGTHGLISFAYLLNDAEVLQILDEALANGALQIETEAKKVQETDARLRSLAFRNINRLQECLTDEELRICQGSKGSHIHRIQQALIVLRKVPSRLLPALDLEMRAMEYGWATEQIILSYKIAHGQSYSVGAIGDLTMRALDDDMFVYEQQILTGNANQRLLDAV